MVVRFVREERFPEGMAPTDRAPFRQYPSGDTREAYEVDGIWTVRWSYAA